MTDQHLTIGDVKIPAVECDDCEGTGTLGKRISYVAFVPGKPPEIKTGRAGQRCPTCLGHGLIGALG